MNPPTSKSKKRRGSGARCAANVLMTTDFSTVRNKRVFVPKDCRLISDEIHRSMPTDIESAPASVAVERKP